MQDQYLFWQHPENGAAIVACFTSPVGKLENALRNVGLLQIPAFSPNNPRHGIVFQDRDIRIRRIMTGGHTKGLIRRTYPCERHIKPASLDKRQRMCRASEGLCITPLIECSIWAANRSELSFVRRGLTRLSRGPAPTCSSFTQPSIPASYTIVLCDCVP